MSDRVQGGEDALPVKRIDPAYQQVANQLRALIIDGNLAPGDRLPNEDKLCSRFGVSRNTVREALRILSSDHLIYAVRGAGGGTFVTAPDVLSIQERLQTSLRLLTGSNEIDHDELFEARALLEIPTVRNAARHRTPEDIDRLRQLEARVQHAGNTLERTENSEDFHQAIFEIAGNRVLSIIAPPVWAALTLSWRDQSSPHRWSTIDHDHGRILQCVEAGDEDGAAHAMMAHLRDLHGISQGGDQND
ncbi:FadR/GntR family transcriptional regulator [Nesterenkonia populi]|uniref:FadR/GntR family transcriptional regulator n=1 Tax=Nesterenkonia populi TaxID=1591087 RepID=UPI0011BD4C5B|nr:FadR/GntR family transcriptional regulator [Nesterenkonia populi]